MCVCGVLGRGYLGRAALSALIALGMDGARVSSSLWYVAELVVLRGLLPDGQEGALKQTVQSRLYLA